MKKHKNEFRKRETYKLYNKIIIKEKKIKIKTINNQPKPGRGGNGYDH